MYSDTNPYKGSQEIVRPSFPSAPSLAQNYYRDLLDFVRRICPPLSGTRKIKLLDVGCGVGWSTYFFAQIGYQATGIDLDPIAFEAPSTNELVLLEGSALDIPFPDETFDLVVSYQCIEHVGNPEKMLHAMIRVCRPGGIICIVGPNLVSPFAPLAYLAKLSSWKRMRYVRQPETPYHPYGNTCGEIIASIFVSSFRLAKKILRQHPQFTMRKPDTRPPFHGDNDACYLCNPSDLITFFKRQGFHLERRGKHGRLPLSYLLAGGTWVAARKPSLST